MNDRPRLALTFDDGPADWTDPILNLLSTYAVRATFFIIGAAIEGREHPVHRARAEGNEIGNHSWSHPRLARDCGDQRVRTELERTNDALVQILGESPRRFRAPHYDVDDRVLRIARELGLTHTHGDITPPDWHEHCSAAYITAYVVQQSRPGAIIGLHDGDAKGLTSRQRTVEALAETLPRLIEQGFEIVTASELLHAPMA